MLREMRKAGATDGLRRRSVSGGKLSPTSLTSKRLPVKAEREADREAGEKALWARVSLGWFWLQEDMKTGGGHERRAGG